MENTVKKIDPVIVELFGQMAWCYQFILLDIFSVPICPTCGSNIGSQSSDCLLDIGMNSMNL